MHSLIITASIVFLAGFVQSVTGFGFAIVATPLLLLVLEPKSVVVISVILYVVLCGLILFHSRQHIDKKRVVLICAGSVFGIPLGAYLLSNLDPSIVKLFIAILVIPFSVLLWLGHSHQFQRDKLGSILAGFISGILTASTSLSGPPVVLFLLNQDLAKDKFVATLAVYFLFAGLLSIVSFSIMGMVTATFLTDIVILVPALLIGFYFGIRVRPKINESLFRRIATSIIFIAALTIIVTSMLELI